jgi:hypothetical protein
MKAEDVSDRVAKVLKNARQALDVAAEFPELRFVKIVVAEDYDCGKTLPSLTSKIKADQNLAAHVEVLGVRGYHSCEVLNLGLRAFSAEATHALIVSGKAMPYFTAKDLRKINSAFAKGAKVAGLAVAELRDIVLSGRIQNTFAAWETATLHEAGMFNSANDVEEIQPLVRIVRKFGRCIAPIDVPARPLEILARDRHEQVMREKETNQLEECNRLGVDFGFIRRGVMR